jgi:hypothetical protein
MSINSLKLSILYHESLSARTGENQNGLGKKNANRFLSLHFYFFPAVFGRRSSPTGEKRFIFERSSPTLKLRRAKAVREGFEPSVHL